MHLHDLGWQGHSSKALRFSEWANSTGVYSKVERDILCLVEIKYQYIYHITYVQVFSPAHLMDIGLVSIQHWGYFDVGTNSSQIIPDHIFSSVPSNLSEGKHCTEKVRTY